MSATHSDVRNCPQAAVTLLEDNQLAISMTKNAQFHSQSKQISVKYHYIWDQVDKGTVNLKYCRDDYGHDDQGTFQGTVYEAVIHGRSYYFSRTLFWPQVRRSVGTEHCCQKCTNICKH